MNGKTLVLEVTQKDEGLVVELNSSGFSSLEIVGVLEKVKLSYIGKATEDIYEKKQDKG